MNVEELKQKTILVEYITNDTIPEKGIRRMTYFTSFQESPEEFHFGLRVRKEEYNRELLEKWTQEGKLVKLIKPEVLDFEKDVFLDNEGNIFFATGYVPLEKTKEIVGNINSLLLSFNTKK